MKPFVSQVRLSQRCLCLLIVAARRGRRGPGRGQCRGETGGPRRDRGHRHQRAGQRTGEEGADRTDRRESGRGRRLHGGQRAGWRVSHRRHRCRDATIFSPSARDCWKSTSTARAADGRVLTLAAGQELKDLRIRLQAAAVVRGRVTDEDGDPSAQRAGGGAAADVCFRAQPLGAGGRGAHQRSWANIASRGCRREITTCR